MGTRTHKSTMLINVRLAPTSGAKAKLAAQRTQQKAPLFDHLIGATEERDWDGEAQRPRRLEVDDQLNFGGLLDGQVGRFLAFENSARVDANQTVSVRIAASIAHQASGCGGECMKLENRGNRVVERQCGEPLALGTEDCLPAAGTSRVGR